jgi:hypothetical protein
MRSKHTVWGVIALIMSALLAGCEPPPYPADYPASYDQPGQRSKSGE